jgi:YbbR domain-containing protein
MKRLLAFLVRNWPLKLAAVTMAVLLYGGLVLSENAQTFEGRIPIEGIDQPRSMVLLSNLGDVRLVRYFASDPGIRLDSSFFRATVDLSTVDPKAGAVSLPVKVVAIDPRVQILEWEPSRINVEVDEVVTRTVPIRVDIGAVPPGLDVREPALAVESASVAGPASVVRRVASALARLRIDPSGLDIDRDVELLPVDDLGEVLNPVDVTPATVRVRIAVFTDRQSKSVPVVPIISGGPALGYEIETVTVTPQVVPVEGDADQLANLVRIETVPVPIAGSASTVSVVAELSLPSGVLPLGQSTVTVRITFRQVEGSRTLSAGIVLVGERPSRVYSLGTDRVLVTVGGPVASLDRLAASAFTVTLDVSALETGAASVPVTLSLPDGVSLLSLSPGSVMVTASAAAPSQAPPPAPSPTPLSSATASPAPSPSP